VLGRKAHVGEHAERGEETFVISWRESGGPPVRAPSRRGFGSIVIGPLAEGSLDAKVALDYASTGLRWRLECPAEEIGESKSHASAKQTARDASNNALSSAGRPRVLVVENEALTAFQIEQTLTEAGFNVVGPAPSVARALEHAGCDAAALDVTLGSETSEP